MKVRKLYIADTHMGHANMIKHDGRPFSDVSQMDRRIISNWNSAAAPFDEVYILGDMFWKNEGAADVLKKLNGKKFLIKGNHDRINAEMEGLFVWVKGYEEIRDGDRHVILCHYPIAHWNDADKGSVHLYGHIPNGRDEPPFMEYVRKMKERGLPYECYNVGCMMPYMDYTPRTLDEIISGAAVFAEEV